MKNETVLMMLAGDTAQVADLNDWAVNTVRDYAESKGWTRDEALEMVIEEQKRIGGIVGPLGVPMPLFDYLHCRRIGSRFCLIRSVRRAVWAIVATRKALRS